MLSNLIILYFGINIILTCIAYKVFKDKSVTIKRFVFWMALGGMFFVFIVAFFKACGYLFSIIEKE